MFLRTHVRLRDRGSARKELSETPARVRVTRYFVLREGTARSPLR